MGDFEWTNELVIRLMQEYERRPALWDPAHEMYRVQTLKYETWRELAAMFECDIADLRKKLNSLFASHRREKGKIRAGGRTSWFLYPYMSFLPTHLDAHAHSAPPAQVTSAKSRPPIKEAARPSLSEDDEGLEPLEHDYEDEQEGEGEVEGQQVHVVVKEEPVTHSYRRLRRQVTHKPRLTRPVKRRFLTKEPSATLSSALDNRLAEALKLLRRSELTRRKDECDSFGEYIADSLRKHDDRTQAMIKQAINNIIFEQEMKKYSTNQQYVVISSIDENPLILGDESDK